MSDAAASGRPLTLVGKRYRCERCGTEILVLRPGTSPVLCHDQPMATIELRPLPSSD